MPSGHKERWCRLSIGTAPSRRARLLPHSSCSPCEGTQAGTPQKGSPHSAARCTACSGLCKWQLNLISRTQPCRMGASYHVHTSYSHLHLLRQRVAFLETQGSSERCGMRQFSTNGHGMGRLNRSKATKSRVRLSPWQQMQTADELPTAPQRDFSRSDRLSSCDTIGHGLPEKEV